MRVANTRSHDRSALDRMMTVAQGAGTLIDLTARPGARAPAGATIAVSDTVDDEQDAASELVALMRSDAMKKPFVIATRHGSSLAARIGDSVGGAVIDTSATQASAMAAARAARRAGADVVVAIGGGRCLDVAKLAAAGAGAPLVVVPTQLSHDGICSPVAVLPTRRGGVTESLEAVSPRLAFFSMPTLLRAPLAATRAGIGDLLSNPFALKDWQLAADAGLEVVDGGAAEASLASYELIVPLLDRPLRPKHLGPGLVTLLAHALALSGTAMLLAGTSRPASGAEHKISHAIDALMGPRASHGEQVAFGCLLVAPLHGVEVSELTRTMMLLGLPHHPHQLGLSSRDLVRVLLRAPTTRPGRFTVLEQAGMEEDDAAYLVRWVWPEL